MSGEDQDFDPIRHMALYAASQVGLFPPPNTSLFRYVSMRDERSWAFLEKTVLENLLPLTPSDSFNDPFDGNPIIINGASSDQIVQLLKGGSLPDGKGDRISVDFNAVSIVRSDGSVLSSAEVEQAAIVSARQSFIEGNKKTRVASFCRRISSQLLWSHYADGYRGLAYHFVVSNEEKSSFFKVHPVRYERQRPILFLREMLDHILRPFDLNTAFFQHRSFSQRAYLTKSIEWAYEEEERLLDRKEYAVLLEGELASIIVGPRFSDHQLNRLKEINSRRSKPLKIFRAQTALTDFGIEIEWSKPI